MTSTLRVPSLSSVSKWLLLVISPGTLLLGQTTSALGITIKAPLDGSQVKGLVIPSLKVSNAVGVIAVQLLADGVPVGAEVTLPPYSVTWNTLLVSNGVHSLSAVARDAAQNRATATISVSVNNVSSQVIAITLGPANANLTASQTQQFTATVTGSSNTGASWSISPQVGSISSGGLYTAPASITSAQSVTVTASSLADPTKTAVAMVGLTPTSLGPTPVSITLGPANTSLQVSQTQQFTATVSGSSNTGVSWSLNPQVGSIASGLYTAPATISSAQNVTVTATSLADPTKTATAVVALIPAVSITLGPANSSLLASQTQPFTATVTGSSNTGTAWSINPQVGSIANGLYTAPATIGSVQNVTVTASSLADPTKTATAVVALTPGVSITVGPAHSTLLASQTQQYTATVTGSSNTGSSWSISPLVGSISNGLYTAPTKIKSPQTVTVTASSLADSTKTATALIALTPVVSITVGPANASLNASQTQQFTTTVTGASQTGVSWTISPALGAVSSSGLYTAPATISNAQNVMLTATSLADATKTAVALIALTLSPVSAQLAISMTAPIDGSKVSGNVGISATTGGSVAGVQFYADSVPVGPQLTVPPYTVNWNSLSVPDGTHNLSAMAQDAAGNRSTTTISVSVSNTPTASAVTVTLPIEVMGGAGTTQTVQVNVPSVPAGTLRLWVQIHGLKYQTEASVQLNNGGWMPINDTTVTLLGRAGAYGGIGGGFSTLKLTMNLPAGTVVAGTNTISFRFNGTDGVTSGFRVLDFNFVAPDGTGLLSGSSFAADDPSTWEAPSSLASDISAGRTLWLTANLTTPGGPIRAKCSSCHAQDGRDLKYFNYSNNSIRVRSMFHGLTAQQGDQIASYIRSLNTPAPAAARPWNPPYQPGPGLDSKPVTEWSAGAGLSGVLESDAGMIPYLMPGGSTAGWAPTSNLSAREIPITLQLPDWNRWLPTVHPLDAWGDRFTSSVLFANYLIIRSQLRFQDPQSYINVQVPMGYWVTRDHEFLAPLTRPQDDPKWNDPSYVGAIYSTRLWSVVKWWELNQEFGLEGIAKAVFGPQADSRAWNTNTLFFASPNMSGIPDPSIGIGNGTKNAWEYFAFMWYELQMLLNNGNGRFVGTYPIDYPYCYPSMQNLGFHSPTTPKPGHGALMTLWLVKALQGSEPGPGPEMSSGGWQPSVNDATQLVKFPAEVTIWNDVSPSQRISLMEGYLRIWLAKIRTFTPQQFYAGGWADPTVALIPGAEGSFGDRIANMIPQYLYQGVDPTLIDQIVAWAKTVWPNFNWDSVRNSTCVRSGAGLAVACYTAN